MDRTHNNENCWPTRRQELLLKASLLNGKEALSAWEEWRSDVDIEQLDVASHRLLPLLYRNLSTHGIEDPVMGKLKGIYLQTWYNNHLMIHRASALLTDFSDAGIKTIVLKGVVLNLLYYKNFGLRPMGDIDVLVPTKEAHRAIDLLRESGWTSSYRFPERIVPVIHGADFVDATGKHHLDLHWHLLIECCQPDADDDFWDGAIPISIEKVKTYALNPADQLLHTLVHGVKWSPVPPFRWIADAIMIMNASSAGVDWDRLVDQAERRRLILPVRHGLRYLHDRFEAPVPAAVLLRLEEIPVSRAERVEFRYKTENHKRKPLGNIPILWFDSSRLSGEKNLFRKLARFFGYVKHFWDVEHVWQLPLQALSLGVSKVRSRLGC